MISKNYKLIILFFFIVLSVNAVDFTNVDTIIGSTPTYTDLSGVVLCNIKAKDLDLKDVKIPIDKYLSYTTATAQTISCKDRGNLKLEFQDNINIASRRYYINEMCCFYKPNPLTASIGTINSCWFNFYVTANINELYKSFRLIYSCEDEIKKD